MFTRYAFYFYNNEQLTDASHQFPDFFKALLEPWIEFREPSLHGVSSDHVVSFSVDSQKRDAVVAAFKVSGDGSVQSGSILTKVAARLAGLWYVVT